MTNESAEHRLERTLLDLTEAQPDDVVITLLRVAPTCDRAAMTIWKRILCSPRTAQRALLILLDVLGDWPEYSRCTSDWKTTGVFALAATVVMWKILQVPCWPEALTVYFPQLFVHLLLQVFFSTEQMPEEGWNFWKRCQEEHGFATSPNRFAVQTLKSLLCQMHHEEAVLSMERKCGWDTLLCADTHHMLWVCWPGETPFSPLHLAFLPWAQGLAQHRPRACGPEGLVSKGWPSRLGKGWERKDPTRSCLPRSPCPFTSLGRKTRPMGVSPLAEICSGSWSHFYPAREMRHASLGLCSRIALHFLWLLSTQEPRWDLPALAFLVEIPEYLDSSECSDSVVQVSSRCLQSECRERRHLALRALLKFIDHPSMAKKMWSLTETLMELLQDKDADIIGMSLIILSFIFTYKYIVVPSPIALQLAEALLPLFDHENSQVQLLSIGLFQVTVDFLGRGRNPLEMPVRQSLLPLFFHCHDENQRVAEASLETLHCAAKFLKRRDLQKLEQENLWMLGDILLAQDRSRAAEHLRRALPYLQSPQESLRAAAIRFIGEPRARAPSPPRRSSAPAPTAAPAAAPGP
ncbi:LOW QUALITY PROTEIN: uncharacterized protein LOC111944273, partial [Cyanistes caeruleus]|uniref:LOW QUALITY PROTEIN: uncharacterized protein LOC111944273 n=1 Tax=Cyanistes caeruleus TaxID=156563 RepID=UPI000CDA6F1C